MVYLIFYCIITFIMILYSIVTKGYNNKLDYLKLIFRLFDFFYLIPARIILLLFVFYGYFFLFKIMFEKWLFEEDTNKKKRLFPPLLLLNESGFLILILLYMLFNLKIVIGIIFFYIIFILFTSIIGQKMGYTLFPYKQRYNPIIGILIAFCIMILLSIAIPIIEIIITLIVYFNPYDYFTGEKNIHP